MSLPDPAPVTVSGVLKNLPRTGQSETSSTYRLVDGANTYTLAISNEIPAKNKRNRVRVSLRREALIDNPLAEGQNVPASLTVAVTADADPLHSPSDMQVVFNALLTHLTSATFLRVAGGET